jgi:hypothetical protein
MSAPEIAAELQQAAGDGHKTHETLSRYYAAEVDIRHVPPGPTDGPWPKRVLVEIGAIEVAALLRALPNAEKETDVEIQDDSIRVRSRSRGRLIDGTDVVVESTTTYYVADGAIVGLRSETDPDTAAARARVLMAGGFEIPPQRLSELSL